MNKIIKVSAKLVAMFCLLALGFAAGLPVGQHMGFMSGSEWAIVQAGIIAREAGVVMPIKFESGNFRVILQQPKHLYTAAWKLADRHEALVQCTSEDKRRSKPEM